MPLDPDQTRGLLDLLIPQSGAMLEAIEELVVLESPSGDATALATIRDRIADRLRALGGCVSSTPEGALAARWEGTAPHARPALVLGHFDTVWPIGTLARMPFRVDGGRAFGPGVYDMKAGIVLIEFALRALMERGFPPERPLEVLLTPDEEVGSVGSRPRIEAAAREAAHVLVLEPPLENGALKTARKGVGRFRVVVRGRAAHAGVEPEKGVNALVELAHQVLAVQALANPDLGTTVNVGLVRGGTTPNVVPAEASAEIDVRASTRAEAARLEAAIGSLSPVLPGAKLEVSGRFNRPPMERSPAIAELFDHARLIARSLDLDLLEGSTGGGSDGNFTAALGVPTLDGLGVPGAGAHADHEQIVIEALPVRAALLAALLANL